MSSGKVCDRLLIDHLQLMSDCLAVALIQVPSQNYECSVAVCAALLLEVIRLRQSAEDFYFTVHKISGDCTSLLYLPTEFPPLRKINCMTGIRVGHTEIE